VRRHDPFWCVTNGQSADEINPAFSPDGKRIITGGYHKMVRIYEVPRWT
jgi:hypothetical protein